MYAFFFFKTQLVLFILLFTPFTPVNPLKRDFGTRQTRIIGNFFFYEIRTFPVPLRVLALFTPINAYTTKPNAYNFTFIVSPTCIIYLHNVACRLSKQYEHHKPSRSVRGGTRLAKGIANSYTNDGGENVYTRNNTGESITFLGKLTRSSTVSFCSYFLLIIFENRFWFPFQDSNARRFNFCPLFENTTVHFRDRFYVFGRRTTEDFL